MNQLLVRAGVYQSAFIQNQNAVGASQQAEAVGDNKSSATLHRLT